MPSSRRKSMAVCAVNRSRKKGGQDSGSAPQGLAGVDGRAAGAPDSRAPGYPCDGGVVSLEPARRARLRLRFSPASEVHVHRFSLVVAPVVLALPLTAQGHVRTVDDGRFDNGGAWFFEL